MRNMLPWQPCCERSDTEAGRRVSGGGGVIGDIFLHIVINRPALAQRELTRSCSSFSQRTKCEPSTDTSRLTVPVLVREELKEAPELLWHAGVAVHERERGQQDLVSNAEETAEQCVLRAKDRKRLQKEEKVYAFYVQSAYFAFVLHICEQSSHTAGIQSLFKQTTVLFFRACFMGEISVASGSRLDNTAICRFLK